jgi:hypothetical protein
MRRHGPIANVRSSPGRIGIVFPGFRGIPGRAKRPEGLAGVVQSALPAVRTRPLLPSLLAISLAFPAQAFAQGPPPPAPPAAPPAPPPVQPVPYAVSQPVPYPGAADAPAGVNVQRLPAPIGSDTVSLKGGGIIRGTLIEAIPNDHATVALATGQSAVIPWDRIERIDRGAPPTIAPAAPARVPAPGPIYYPSSPPPPPPSQGSAFVHIEGDQPVTVERKDGRTWSLACSSPCDAELPLGVTYRVGGAGIRNSSPFRLNAQPGDRVILDVNTASKGSFVGGIVVAGVGVVVLLVGAMVLLTVATVDTADSQEGFANPSSDGSANTVGWVMLAGGAAATLVGVLVLTSNVHSKVDQTPGTQRPPRTDAWLRTPTWHDDKTGAGLPKIVGVPLFQTTF